MGAKTSMLVYADGNVAETLARNPLLERTTSAREAARLFPKDKLVALEDGRLTDVYPRNRQVCIGCFGSVTIVAAKEFSVDRPSRLDSRFVDFAAGRDVYLHAMHSVVDWLAFAVWRRGSLVRALSVAPDNGVIEEVGARLPFELPFWDGQHPPIDHADEDERDAYPLAFHPLDLGEAALRHFFGFQLEGAMEPSLLDSDRVALLRFERKRSLLGLW